MDIATYVEHSLKLKHRLATLRWLLPMLIAALAVLYEQGLGRWIHDTFGASQYFDLDILFYATIVPLLAFLSLTRIGHWLDQKERAELKARASELRLAAITTASADAILSLDVRGRIESWNRGGEMIFGYRTEEVAGQPFTKLLGSGEAAEAEFNWLMAEMRQSGLVRAYETTGHDSAGRLVWIGLTATSLETTTGASSGMSVILRDITERKRREEEVQRLNVSLSEQVAERTRELAEKVGALARANAELQKLDQMRMEFVSIVSHQIRAPLTNMQGAVERMESDCTVVNLTCKRMFDVLSQQASRLDRLVSDVLSAARIDADEIVLHPEPISILPVAQQIANQIKTRTHLRPIHLPTKPGLPFVFADRERVAEVISNLLDNADKYSPPGTPVEIDLRADETGVTLCVRDRGKGLPKADLDRIFDKFYRVNGGDDQSSYGYGLGLYVCRKLIEAQGGRIWAENHRDGGAVFSITLPIAR
jgi:PAS domain S-box-containing protein